MENWKVIDEFPNYSISDLGNVRNKYGKTLEQVVSYNGYSRVRFVINKRIYRRSVHRLVAKAFVPNSYNKETVNHKNGKKDDNKVDNLEWATYSENHKHSFKELGRKSFHEGKKGSSHIRAVKIGQFEGSNVIEEFGSIIEASQKTGIKASNISLCASGKRLTAGKYIWKYL